MIESELDLAVKQPAIRLWRRLVYTTQGKVREVEAVLAPLGLTMTEFDLLAVLRRFDGATQQEVAQRLLFTEANMSYHAKRLVARGLIERQTAGKRKLLRLTATGQHLVEQALPKVLEIHELQFSDLNDEELMTLRNLLRRLK
ncbi:MarR family winged helix-turn-helix transcriptional regulator [Deinococcus wulumuqiensis]|uniref:HTH marR-type domain-containing protein n=1 Tax=Deinococcus wulumuqiensis TaxID=980427 RepID=A0AAV4KBV8_9DEIO|nr:MarR family transcriptional regulator [Deinococcus wulumuqiensis]QII22392.1 MarR family transcriptional regulator [Deinococcus wulumuqiensis R12]GGI69557.1 hypothetical protein GCM10008021_32090 [Deinococcus wulumuqiensis]GGI95113.1 hypothetical protein GCM10010914_32010 [Deinococcus wulumuqiensis]